MQTGDLSGNPLLNTEWEPCLLEKRHDPELEAFARQRMGVVPSFVLYLADCPWLVRAQVRLHYSHGQLMYLDPELAELVSMVASLEGACRYCYATSRFLLRIHGMSEARIRELETSLGKASEDPRQSTVIGFARRMSRSDPLIRQADKQALIDAGFTPEVISEMGFVVAFTALGNRTATLTALSPRVMEELPGRWSFSLLRPLISRQLSKHMTRGTALAERPDYSGPYDYLVSACGSSPFAGSLAISLEEMWQESVLTRRCKTLILAVVAHALGCTKTAEQSGKLLEAQGISAEARTKILNHLHSDVLDKTEAILVPFARQTVWYQPVQVQQKARRVLEQLGQARFTEAIGVIAFANALCRLGAVIADQP